LLADNVTEAPATLEDVELIDGLVTVGAVGAGGATTTAAVDTTLALVLVEVWVVPLETTVAVATLPAAPLVKLIELPVAVVPLGKVQ
jgi:hypothetical protein